MDGNTTNEIDNRLPYRKGWPKPLPILPLGYEHLSSREVRELFPNKEEIEGFLKRHGVVFQFWFPCNRFNDWQRPDPENITLLIHCKGLENLSVAALEEIRDSFQNSGWWHQVEFVDYDQVNAPLRCISPDDPIVREWEETQKERVLRMIDDLEWQTVDVFHCGTAIEKDECPVTVIISAWDATSDVWWEHVLPHIRAECGLEVRLLQASSMQATSPDDAATRLAVEAFTGPLAIGGSLGPLGENGTGTLGGFIKLEWPDGKTEWLGLTNHHVVREDRLKKATKMHGYFPPNHLLARDSCLLLVSPSDHDTDTWLSSVASTITQLETVVNGDPERGLIGLRAKVGLGEASKAEFLRRNLTKIDNLRSNDARARNVNREAGSVIATSGYRTVEIDGRHWCMDWALVRLPTLRDIDTALETHDMLCELDRWSSKQLMADNRVLKQGRTTGYTEGRINGIETTVKIAISEEQRNSDSSPRQGSAWAIIDEPGEGTSMIGRSFSAPGDSGSLILDVNGRVIGLLFATQNCITYFIPFASVMEDVQFVTGRRVLTPTEDITGLEDSTDA
ncbi:hypothetical protein AJ80_05190 [Polytolypa hystricis UAMH7299]|uniref:Peptidase S7 domain-containing protein n=1 Tax=Polytolypa hystricis (strain UAMH7299) TaxID=1447883 RepID=A0A2B7Y5M6_POLH7|nr:hypothetical protein AJ80_05190 [Polytolypa hystricis UAMH7299]